MAQHLSELCTLLVDDFYGELSSRVFSVLARVGRLSVAGLVRHCDLPVRHLKHGLVVLIQQHLALHHTSDDDGLAYYEVNWSVAYGLVRSGKIIKLVEDRFGEQASGLIMSLLLLGHARVSDLTEAYGVSDVATSRPALAMNDAGVATESNARGSIRTLSELQNLLKTLLQSGLVMRVHETQFRSAADVHNDAERSVRVTDFPQGVNGSKDQKLFRASIQTLKRKWREGAAGVAESGQDAHGLGTKSWKRAKGNGYRANGTNTHTEVNGDPRHIPLKGEVTVRINHKKFDVTLRNQHLVDLACNCIGETTSKVYEAFLSVLERKTAQCYDDLEEPSDKDDEHHGPPEATTKEILDALDKDVNLSMGNHVDTGSSANKGGVPHAHSEEDGDEENEEWASRPKRTINGQTKTPNHARQRGLVEDHMRLLAQSPRKFVRREGSRGHGPWKVDFDTLSKTLIQQQLENLVSARFNTLATRVVRILHAKGKLDEKQVTTIALSRQKDIRYLLSAMQEVGYVEIQEVPKDATRQPSRTTFLWFFDQDRCRQLVLNDTYKAMARLLQQIKVQKARVQLVIDKGERSDVVGNEDRLLTTYERQTLREWRSTEEKLLTQLGRQDDLVAVLRDFAGPGLG